MSKINDGGSAFPAGDARGYEPSFGMTLRDYFAAHALTGLITKRAPSYLKVSYYEFLAMEAYNIADAMVASQNASDE